MLFDLKDEAETTNLAGKNLTAPALFGEMMRYLKAVDARIPSKLGLRPRRTNK